MAKYSGSGWHKQSIRHSNARKYGKAGGRYAIVVKDLRWHKGSLAHSKNVNETVAKRLKILMNKEYGTTTADFKVKKIAKNKHYGKARPKAPLKEESTELPIQFSINIPSTKNKNEPITPQEFQARIEETKKFLSDNFGGDTEVKGKGDYTKDGKLIQEDVSVIESSMTPEAYNENKSKLEQYIADKHKEWTQDTMGFSFEDAFYIYPKFD